MSRLTITEALAEIKTIGKRVQKKRAFVRDYIYRQEALKDPFQKEGGSVLMIQRGVQSIRDLEERLISLRRAIAKANEETVVSIKGQERTIADWLVWAREVAPQQTAFLNEVSALISGVRQEAMRRGASVSLAEGQRPQDFVVNIDEQKLAESIEELEEIKGTLDGQLSLKNATVFVEL